jgi:hypothetical protein
MPTGWLAQAYSRHDTGGRLWLYENWAYPDPDAAAADPVPAFIDVPTKSDPLSTLRVVRRGLYGWHVGRGDYPLTVNMHMTEIERFIFENVSNVLGHDRPLQLLLPWPIPSITSHAFWSTVCPRTVDGKPYRGVRRYGQPRDEGLLG